MPLNNAEIRRYDSNVLRLPKDKREIYNAQVDRLIKALAEQDSRTAQDHHRTGGQGWLLR